MLVEALPRRLPLGGQQRRLLLDQPRHRLVVVGQAVGADAVSRVGDRWRQHRIVAIGEQQPAGGVGRVQVVVEDPPHGRLPVGVPVVAVDQLPRVGPEKVVERETDPDSSP
jgi:hypothetical protein